MALATTSGDGYVTATATGNTDHISLPPGEYTLSFSSGSAYGCDLQVGDGTTFHDAYWDSSTQVQIDSTTGPQEVVVVGGKCYRMNVTTYNTAITMRASQATRK